MCGRFGFSMPPRRAAAYFGLDLPPALAGFRFPGDPATIRPGTHLLAGRIDPATGRPTLALLRWGLIPAWARDAAFASKCINARSETMAEKPAFRDAFRQRRCLIPADLFYEWTTAGKVKTPHAIRVDGGAPFAMAGLWETWTDPATGEAVATCAIVTTQANAAMAALHERMPVLLDEAARAAWLAPRTPPPALAALCAPSPLPLAITRLAPGSV
ncbi:MAG: SOS response-associated peptidase [Desulfovibrionaceae bacterium]